ncbi:MAG: HipA N-terminal domain-containing protein [Lautropia sp.]|nr:HipA N-terminal domain-containing protein [Lautropia sp.]
MRVVTVAHELAVWLFTDRVGTLALVNGRLSFWYEPEWLSRQDAIALSASLPLQAQAFDDHGTRPFLFHDDASPVVRWTATWLDTAGLSITYARPSYAGAF